jgi:diazepam-binding inhibitor (GABA receptor modulating acyl-CoA-binding protein)
MKFEEAIEQVKKIKTRPDDGKLLQLYGLYKQATIGDCNIAEPWFYEVEAKAKWSAWKSREGMSAEACKKKYVKYVEELIAKD